MKEYAFHPIADEYPLMPAYELGRMEEGMRERGFDERFPVVLYQGKILDGRNRYLAAKAAGLQAVPTVTFRGTEDEARLFAQAANEERRHLAAEWLQKRRQERIERVQQARADGQSLRTIAGAEGVSEATIRNDLSTTSGAQGCAPETQNSQGKVDSAPQNGQKNGETHKPPSTGKRGGSAPKKVTGKDGKTYAASKPKAPELCERCARLKTLACDDCRAKFPDGFPAPKPPKNGRVTFDDRKVHDAFGALVRLLGQRKDSRGDHPEREKCLDRLDEALSCFRRWQEAGK